MAAATTARKMQRIITLAGPMVKVELGLMAQFLFSSPFVCSWMGEGSGRNGRIEIRRSMESLVVSGSPLASVVVEKRWRKFLRSLVLTG